MSLPGDSYRLSEGQVLESLNSTAVVLWNWEVPTGQLIMSHYVQGSSQTEHTNSRNIQLEEFIHPEDLPTFRQVVDDNLKQNCPFEIEHRIKIQDGDWQWVSTRGNSVERDENGDTLRIAGACWSITNHSQDHTILEDSQASYQTILSTISDTVVITDNAGVFKFVCPNIHIIFGYQDYEVLAMPHISHLFGFDLLAQYTPGTFTEIKNIELQIVDKAGAAHVLLVNLKAVSIHGGTVLLTCRDITERRRVEETLRQSEAMYRIIVDNAQEGIWVLDNSYSTTYANRRMAQIFGYPNAEMIGMTVFDFLDEALHDEVARNLDERQRRGSIQTERKWRRKDGTEVWTIVAANNLYDVHGVQVGTLALVTDITERKQAEEALRVSEERLRSMVESFGDFIFVFDAEDRYIDCYLPNNLNNLYAMPELFLGKYDKDVMPDHFLERSVPLVEKLRRTGKPQRFEYWLNIGGQTMWFTAQLTARLDTHGNYIGRTQVSRDITEQKRAEDRLKYHYDFQHLLIRLALRFINIPSEEFGRTISEALKEVCEFLGGIRCIINEIDEEFTHFTRVYEWHAEHINSLLGVVSPLLDPETLIPRLAAGEIVIGATADELSNWPQLAHELSKIGAQAAVLVPLVRGGRLREVVSITWSEPLTVGPEAIDLMRVVGEIYQNAIERKERDEKLRELNLELEQRVHERTAQLREANAQLQAEVAERKQAQDAEHEQRVLAEALRNTASAINSTLKLDEVLDRILINIDSVVKHDVANVMLIEDGTARVVRYRGYPSTFVEDTIYRMRFPLATTANLQWLAKERKPLLIPDVTTYPGWIQVPELDWLNSYLGVPISFGDEVIGFLGLDSSSPNFFSDQHAQRLQAFADQAAIAIGNARLFEQANTIAAMEERQRLARELHDSVSQMLFSANSIAESLPRILERHPDKLTQYMIDLRNITRGAMGEMRSLLIELRPEALTQIELGLLIQHLCDALTGRTQIQIEKQIDRIQLPPDIQIAFYRIAQEAFNNIAKHAHATKVSIALHWIDSTIEMVIKDNGDGFDPALVLANHFGLQIMQERAAGVNADFAVHSRPGDGAEILVTRRIDN